MILGLSAASLVILAVTALAAVTSAGVAYAAYQRRDTPAAREFVVFGVAVALWNTFVVATHLAPDQAAAVVCDTVASVFSLAVPFAWFEFAVVYTGYGSLLTRRRRALLWLPPLLFAVNGGYQLTRPTLRAGASVQRFDGLWFVVESLQSAPDLLSVAIPFCLTVVAFGLLFSFILRTQGGYRKQAAAVSTGGAVAFLTLVAFLTTGIGPVRNFDPTPMANAVTVLVVGVALFKWDFLEMVPVATDRLFAEMSDPVFVLASNRTVANANPAAGALADGDPEGDPIDRTVPALADALDADVDTVRIDDQSGTDRTYDLNQSVLYDPYGRQRGQLLVLRDITVQVERERELERQNERLDRFASVVSHDLRNPLNVAYGFAERAAETGDLSCLDRSLAAMEDMDDLVDDLLTLAREGETVRETTATDLADVAADAWPVPEEDPSLVVETTGEIQADRDRLSELLGNCFRNALEHGGEDVTVWVGALEDGFYVEDDGPGIPPEERESVFESGYTTTDDGTGLGLSIVAEIAGAHGWSIDVEEGRAGGARFVVSGATVRR